MDNYEKLKKEFKKNMEILINQNRLDEAKEFLTQYENIVKDDIEIYSIKGVIAMMEGKFEEAEKILKEGLELQPLNFDMLYDLAYLYEYSKKYLNAYRYYDRALKVSDEKYVKDISYKLEELRKIDKVKKYIGRKKVLFTAHIFPPVGGSGVQRSLKFVKYLRNFGWEPIVVTAGKTIYPLRDETMVAEIPEEIEVIRIDERNNIDVSYANKLIQIYNGVVNNDILMQEYVRKLNKSKEDISQLLVIPDYYILWATEVLDKIHDKVDFKNIDMIYTTSGPYSDHIIGYYLKQKYNKPWVADFRDEWTNNPYIEFDKNNILYKLQYLMEKNIVDLADKVITTTPIASQNYINRFNLESNKVVTITNGYDEKDFVDIDRKKIKNQKFTMMHNGLLYMIRTPETILMALKSLLDKKLIDKNKIKLVFTWTEHDEHWKNVTKKLGLDNIVEFTGYLNHKESLRQANNADLLLLIVGDGEKNKSVYSGKVFEYLRLCKPILSLSPKNSLVEQLINKTNRGKNVEFNDVDGIEKHIFEMYKRWEADNLPTLDISDNINKYDRVNLTRKLSTIFNEELKFRVNKRILKNINGYIKNNDFTNTEEVLLKYIDLDKNNFELLYMLADLYSNTKQYYLAYKFYNMALKECNYKYIKREIRNKINLTVQSNSDYIQEFKRLRKYNFIICGTSIDLENVKLLEQIGYIEGCINDYSNNVYKIKLNLNDLSNKEYDYIIILEKDKNISKKIIDSLMKNNVDLNKIFNFYSYSYPYFIEGFETKFNQFLMKQKIELLVTGLSYSEVGVNCDKLSVPSFNFSLSGQDIFYDYYLTKYLLNFNVFKNNIKKICINMAYYSFDWDLSLSPNSFTRIHRYLYTLGKTHNYNNILHLKLCHSIYKSKDYERDYLNYHRYKLNTVLKDIDYQQEKIAKKQANMNYPKTVIENKYIFEMYLKMLNENNIKPIILILPTSRHYYKYFSNNYQKNKFYKIINQFRKVYNFKVIDYFNSKIFNDEDFCDYSHLNNKGALKFTSILEKELSSFED